MEVLIVRHAIAVPRGTPGIADEERPLTPEGEKKFRRAARGLARVAGRPDAVLTSPLPRARRTAEIAAEAWGGGELTEAPQLGGGEVDEVLSLLARHSRDASVALFGHEPQLSELLSRLLGVEDAARVTFKKGGAALLDVQGEPRRGGTLLWFLPPRILRELGG